MDVGEQSGERMSDFTDALIDGVPDDTDREHFKIDGPRTADWALRKLQQSRALYDANESLAREEIERIKGWVEIVNESHVRDINYFEAILEHYHQACLEDDANAKTIKLPSGQLRARKMPTRVEVDDEQFDVWAHAEHPEWFATVVKREVGKADLRKHIESTGEILPGVTLIEGAVRFEAVTE